MSDILVISSGIIPSKLQARRRFSGFLRQLGGYHFDFSMFVRDLGLLKSGEYSAVVLFLGRSSFSRSQFKELEDFIVKGGGLLALHSTSFCFHQHPDLWDMIGAGFLSDGAVAELTVQPNPDRGEIFSEIGAFSLTDAIPQHKLAPGVRVHFYAESGMHSQPVVWTKEYYLGRVAYCALGHLAPVFSVPQVQSLIAKSICWISENASHVEAQRG